MVKKKLEGCEDNQRIKGPSHGDVKEEELGRQCDDEGEGVNQESKPEVGVRKTTFPRSPKLQMPLTKSSTRAGETSP